MSAIQQVLLALSAAAAAPTTDTDFYRTGLLLHFDGTNGQTTTTDSSNSAHAMTLASCSLSTAQQKFGASSLGSAGSGLSCIDTDDFTIRTGQFTVEAWVRWTTAPSTNTYCIASSWGTNDRGWFFGMVSGSLVFQWSTDGLIGTVANVGAAWTPTTGQWYHVAADRDASNVLRVYVDGAVLASSTITASVFDAARNLEIAYNALIATTALPGYLDDLRITKGFARYGGAFTPPSAAFPDTGTSGYRNAYWWYSGGSGADTGWTNYTKREVIDKSLLGSGGTKIKVSVIGHSTGCTFDKMYIQTRATSGNSYDFSTTPVQITFNSGSAGISGLVHTEQVSDELAFTFDGTKDLVISYHLTSGNLVGFVGEPQSGLTSEFYKSGDDAISVTSSGMSASGSRMVSRLQIYK